MLGIEQVRTLLGHALDVLGDVFVGGLGSGHLPVALAVAGVELLAFLVSKVRAFGLRVVARVVLFLPAVYVACHGATS